MKCVGYNLICYTKPPTYFTSQRAIRFCEKQIGTCIYKAECALRIIMLQEVVERIEAAKVLAGRYSSVAHGFLQIGKATFVKARSTASPAFPIVEGTGDERLAHYSVRLTGLQGGIIQFVLSATYQN